MRGAFGTRRATLIAWSVIATAACSGADGGAPPTGATAPAPAAVVLAPVAAPELTGAEPGLRERVDARVASLHAIEAEPAAPAARRAAAYGEVGKLLIAAEFYREAEPFLRNARALAPGELAWAYLLGQTYRLQQDRERAGAAFEQALRIDPAHIPSLVWLGALQLDRGERERAEALFARALAADPASAAARAGLGRVALARGEFAAARDHLERALAAAPGQGRLHYPLAMAYRGLRDTARAEEHLRAWRAAAAPGDGLLDSQLPPADPLMESIGSLLETAVAYETRGTRALDAGDYAAAVALFRQGLDIAPDDPTLHQNLGSALFLAGDAAGARAAFQAALRLAPGYARAHYGLGVLLDASGDDREAIARLTSAVEHAPGMTAARFSLAEALRRTGEFEAAIGHYEQIVQADPGASQARFGRAMALVRLGRHAAARAALEEATALHADQPGFPHALARLLAASPDPAVRDGARAAALVDRLRRQFGDNPTLLETSAMVLAEQGRFGEAAARQRHAITVAQQQGRDDLLAAMQDNLRRYEAGEPCRKPWADTDPVHQPRTTHLE